MIKAWGSIEGFSTLRKNISNLEILAKSQSRFAYNGKVGFEALEEVLKGHKSAKKFLENLNDYEKLFGEVDELTISAIKSSSEVRIVNAGKQVGHIAEGRLTVKYAGYGGNIVCDNVRTTTVLGRFFDDINGGGTSVAKNSNLFKYGESRKGINLLNDPEWTWDINKQWLIDAVNRVDVIRVMSDPTNMNNIWIDGIIGGTRTTYRKEIRLLEDLGYKFNPSTFQFVK